MEGIEDKREITGVLAVNMAGELLPPQIIYSGTTERCLPSFKFPDAWHITCSQNHWSTESTMLAYIDKVIKPYINSVSPDGKTALCLFDTFAAHKTESVKAKLESLNIKHVFIPPGCTGELQPLDLTVNDYFKKCLRKKFNDWYSEEVERELRDGLNPRKSKANFQLLVMKPIHAQWIVEAFNDTNEKRDMIIAGFGKAGIISSYVDVEDLEFEYSTDEEDEVWLVEGGPQQSPEVDRYSCRYPLV